MDSYYVEGTQTVIRQEIYEKILLQQKSPFYTKDLFSISMRNVNERIISERKIIVPERPENYKNSVNSSLETINFTPALEIEVRANIETPPKGYNNAGSPEMPPKDSDDADSLGENSEKELSEKQDMSRSSGSGKSDQGGQGEDLETVVTDVEDDSTGNSTPKSGVEEDSLRNSHPKSSKRRISCTQHEGDFVDMTQFRVGESR